MQLYALRYGIPTLPFVRAAGRERERARPRSGPSTVSSSAIDTTPAGSALLPTTELGFEHPHHVPRSSRGATQRDASRCAAIVADDADARSSRSVDGTRGARAGSARPGSRSGPAKAARRVGATSRVHAISGPPLEDGRASQDGDPGDGAASRSARAPSRCPSFRPASVRPGMAMFSEDGGFDVVASVEGGPLGARSMT